MSLEVSDYLDVAQRASELGIDAPSGFCILPRRFDHANAAKELCHESSALDLKTLFRQAALPVAVYQPEGARIPYLQENDSTWIGPLLFVSAAAYSQNPGLLSVALSVVANYVTDLFRGSPDRVHARLSVVIETRRTKTTISTTKRIDFDGPPDEIAQIAALVKEIADDGK